MEPTTQMSEKIVLVEKRKKTFNTIIHWVFVILLISITPEALFGLVLGGGPLYFLIACTPIVILLLYKKVPSLSYLFIVILLISTIGLDLRDMIHGKEPEWALFTMKLIVALVFQIFSILNSKNKLDNVFTKMSPLILAVLLFALSVFAIKIENLIFILLK